MVDYDGPPLPLLRSRLLTELGVVHGFTTRVGGVSEGRYASLNLGARWGDDPGRVEENLRRVAAAGGFSRDALCQVRQVHGTAVLPLGAPERLQREADGMATDQALCLGVLAADCVGLLLCDGRGRVAAAHAGWRGTIANIAAEAVAALVALGSRPAELRAALSPSIGPCCFEVGEDVAAHFAEVPGALARNPAGRTVVDLRLVNRTFLERAGLRPEHIDDQAPCSRCDAQRFFSYRRDGAHIGQQLAFIVGGRP